MHYEHLVEEIVAILMILYDPKCTMIRASIRNRLQNSVREIQPQINTHSNNHEVDGRRTKSDKQI
jgi:predicted secreted Zn-dependent protease